MPSHKSRFQGFEWHMVWNPWVAGTADSTTVFRFFMDQPNKTKVKLEGIKREVPVQLGQAFATLKDLFDGLENRLERISKAKLVITTDRATVIAIRKFPPTARGVLRQLQYDLRRIGGFEWTAHVSDEITCIWRQDRWEDFSTVEGWFIEVHFLC